MGFANGTSCGLHNNTATNAGVSFVWRGVAVVGLLYGMHEQRSLELFSRLIDRRRARSETCDGSWGGGGGMGSWIFL